MGKQSLDDDVSAEHVATDIVGLSFANTAPAENSPTPADRCSPPTTTAINTIPLPVSPGAGERYQFRCLLGKGGMGEVHLCKDLTIGREVATKRILSSHAGDPELRNRFISEAQIQGQLEHPAIVPVYDLAVSPDGNVFFTMRRLRGRTLEDILKALQDGKPEDVAAFPRHRLLTALASVCLAVEFAHSRGVLHRDVWQFDSDCRRIGGI